MTKANMLHLEPILELEIVGIYDRGIPNKERVVLRPNMALNLQGFVLGAGWEFPNGTVFPISDRTLFFTEQWIDVESWVVIYTGKGASLVSEMPTGETAYTYHWGRSAVLFSNPRFTAFLARVSAIQVFQTSRTLPSLGNRK